MSLQSCRENREGKLRIWGIEGRQAAEAVSTMGST